MGKLTRASRAASRTPASRSAKALDNADTAASAAVAASPEYASTSGRDAPGCVRPQGESLARGPSTPYLNPRPDRPDRRRSAVVCRRVARTAQATRLGGVQDAGHNAGKRQDAGLQHALASGRRARLLPDCPRILTWGLPMRPGWISTILPALAGRCNSHDMQVLRGRVYYIAVAAAGPVPSSQSPR